MNDRLLDRETLLLQLKFEREFISELLKNEELPKIQLLMLFNYPNEYGLTKANNFSTLRTKVYKQIYNSPFLLCDQEYLNPSIKKPLEMFLNRRFEQELLEANYFLNKNQIAIDEYLNIYDDLKFCYYESSEEGKKILEKKRYR